VTTISDFSDAEMWTINSTLRERYQEKIELEQVETEMRLNPYSIEPVTCPAIFWERDKCHFIICKTGDRLYRCQFYYRLYQMYGTGVEEYDDLSECIVSLLQVQADQNRQEEMEANE